jgi:hypothetical protein
VLAGEPVRAGSRTQSGGGGGLMLEPKPLTFGGDWTEIELDGVPGIESALRAFVGRCQECGSAAEDQHEGSALVNPFIVEGTLYGDSFCVDCVDEDEVEGLVFFLPPLTADDAEEGGE